MSRPDANRYFEEDSNRQSLFDSQPVISSRLDTLSSNNILHGINERVVRVEAVCRESEAIATDTLDELGTQRETLSRARERLAETNTELSAANKVLRTIHRRIVTNKLLLAIIIFLEILIIGLQLYLKFK